MTPRAAPGSLGFDKEVIMREKKASGLLERNAHKFALGGQALAIGSALLLVPIVRRLRAR